MDKLKNAALLAAGVSVGIAVAGRVARRRNKIDFAGRSVVITGGSRGLGLVMARLLVAEGARLAIIARDEADLERAAAELRLGGAEVLPLVCDVRDQQAVARAIDEIVNHYGGIDVLINNAGIIQVGPIEHMQLEDFRDAMDTHLWAPLYTTLAATPHMKRQGGGRIVNIASVGGKVALPHMVPYSASKFALVGLSDGLRAELAKDGIFVTTVCPFVMRSGSHLNATFKGQHEKEFTFFALLGSVPPNSISVLSAARQVVEACRYGDPQLLVSIQARGAAAMSTLLPNLTAKFMSLGARLMPAATDAEGDAQKTGWESRTKWAPSPLTRLADRATEENNELRGHTI
ncbi:MAG TPA: SDR family oxidoreductase [Abditibacteriaceae bacterium]|nr:SDR family oxidoreductase [Abditibacteriaceae bacterium]